MTGSTDAETEVLVVGAGPGRRVRRRLGGAVGSRRDVLADAATFPRDKTCGDGLTPRAIAELDRLGLGEWVRSHVINRGLRATRFRLGLELPWPGGSLPDHGSAVPRMELDDKIRDGRAGRRRDAVGGARAVDVVRDGERVTGVVFDDGRTPCGALPAVVVADGVRSPLGRLLGREWHRDTAYGVAAAFLHRLRPRDDEWISSHLELRGEGRRVALRVRLGVPAGRRPGQHRRRHPGHRARPAQIRLRSLMSTTPTRAARTGSSTGPCAMPTSALLPMGGAVSHVAGHNWALIGDAAGCVNPLNGEGIDYGLETGRLVAELLVDERHLGSRVARHCCAATTARPFSIARRLAGLLTLPRLLPVAGPVGMRSRALMTVALRVMGNLVTDEDRDLTARAWRTAGRLSHAGDSRPPFS